MQHAQIIFAGSLCMDGTMPVLCAGNIRFHFRRYGTIIIASHIDSSFCLTGMLLQYICTGGK